MCLGIPGKVLEWVDRDPLFARAVVEFEGVNREVHMACVPMAYQGDYVIVHAGVAICLIDAEEALRVLEELRQLDLLEGEPDSGNPRIADGGNYEISR